MTQWAGRLHEEVSQRKQKWIKNGSYRAFRAGSELKFATNVRRVYEFIFGNRSTGSTQASLLRQSKELLPAQLTPHFVRSATLLL
jgi:hypothetical protein